MTETPIPDESATPAEEAARPFKLAGRSGVAIAFFLTVVTLILIADLGLKYWSFSYVAGRQVVLTDEVTEDHRGFWSKYPHDPIVVVPKVLELRLTTNTGAVFGLGKGNRLLFIAVSVVATVIIGLMFIGGCAGSTAGGIKVIRFWIAIKVMLASLERAFRPQVVRPLRVSGGIVDDEMKLGALTYCLVILLLVAGGALVIGLFETHAGGFEIDFLTAATASLSPVGNIGPGFNGIGATQNYGWFSTPSLALMSLLMMLGRLEVYAVAVLLLPRFWRGN